MFLPPRLLSESLFCCFFAPTHNCCSVVLSFGSQVLRLHFPSPGLLSHCSESNDFVELSSFVLYLTSVLSKSSLSTAEKFEAGFAEFLSCRVISGYRTALYSYLSKYIWRNLTFCRKSLPVTINMIKHKQGVQFLLSLRKELWRRVSRSMSF